MGVHFTSYSPQRTTLNDTSVGVTVLTDMVLRRQDF
jgi:hypothetical protein